MAGCGWPRSSASCRPVRALIAAAERHARIDEQLELFRELEVAYAHGADLADARAPGPKARCLEIHYDERGVLEQDLGSGRIGEPHRIAPPGQPRVLRDDLFEQASGEPDGRLPQGKEAPCRILGVDRPPPLLDQLDEPVGRIQSQLHGESLGEHMFVCNDRAEMTLSQLALTVLLLAALGLGAHRLGRLGDPRLPARRAAPGAARAAPDEPDHAVRGDGVRGRARDRLPALLPRTRVQPRAPRAQQPPRRARRQDRPRHERCARARRRRRSVRAHVRRSDPCRARSTSPRARSR